MRIDPQPTGSELDTLCQYLDYQRETMLLKTDGLTRAQLAQPLPPSTLTLGGLLNHLALVEDSWFEERFLGRPEREPWAGIDWDADPDWEFRTAADLEPDQLRERYRQACERSRATVAAATSLDQLSVLPLRSGSPFSLRWMLFHLLEETARHAGHADLLREAIDGTVGE
ncbi:MAG TPA: DinB family protein [Jatrophihabitans sp.]|nr:DinB family protein [Jatrophihabitans sp.]